MLTYPQIKNSLYISGDTTELRYQKAIKEITKLISSNGQLKEEIKRDSKIIASQRQEIKQLNKLIQKSNQEKQELEKQLQEMQNKIRDLEKDFAQIDRRKKQKKQKMYVQMFHDDDFDNIRSSVNQYELYYRKYHELEEKNEFLQKKILEQQKINEGKIKQKLSEIFQLKKKISQLQDYLNSRNSQSVKKRSVSFQPTDYQLNGLSKQEVIKRLKVLHYWNKNTTLQCVQLKSKLLNYQTQTTSLLTRTKSEKILQIINTPENIPPDYLHKSFTQVSKKLKIVQEQKNIVTKKYDSVKVRLESIEVQFTQLTKQNEKNQKIIEGYQKIIEKQQKQIQSLVDQYQKDMNKMTQEFKDRLVEQRQNFGPAKNSKQIKLVQILQTQNKSLKKKFQMCSVELTKCFRYLQTYKKKLAQYQTSCNQLITENAKLTEKVTTINKQTSPLKKKLTLTNNAGFSQSPRFQASNAGDQSPIKIKIQ